MLESLLAKKHSDTVYVIAWLNAIILHVQIHTVEGGAGGDENMMEGNLLDRWGRQMNKESQSGEEEGTLHLLCNSFITTLIQLHLIQHISNPEW